MVAIDVTRTRIVRERLHLEVDAAEWERIFGTPLDPGAVTGLQVNEFFDALRAESQVTATDIDADVWTNVEVTPNDSQSGDDVAATRYQYDRARVYVSETLEGLRVAQTAARHASEAYDEAERWEAGMIENLSVVELLASERG